MYITSLNYLDTNFFLILLFFSFLKNITPSLFFFLKFLLNLTSYIHVFFLKKLLTSLIIGTIVIHPVMFYIFLIIFLIKFYLFKKVEVLFQFFLSNYMLLLYLSITMLLGGFWATQSDSWGYFWVNDLIEWFLLFIILFLIVFLHNLKLKKTNYNFFFIHSFLLIFLILIRLGFFATRHNFIGLELSIYKVYFTYISIFYLLNRLSLTNFFYKQYKYITFFIVLIFFSNYLYFCKFLTVYIFLIYFYTLSSHHYRLYFHYIFIVFTCIWFLPFIFFKTFSINMYFLNLKPLTIFYTIFSNNFTLSYQFLIINTLSSINFIISFFKYSIFIFFKSKLTLFLNNSQLIYLLLIAIFFWKIVWI